MVQINDLDELANLWNKTKNPKYKKLWYETVKEMYGSNIGKRRIVSISSCYKADDGTYVVVGKRN